MTIQRAKDRHAQVSGTGAHFLVCGEKGDTRNTNTHYSVGGGGRRGTPGMLVHTTVFMVRWGRP